MRRIASLLVLFALTVFICAFSLGRSDTPAAPAPLIQPVSAGTKSPTTVRVAAVQCYSRMGRIEQNRTLLTRLINEAAEGGAQIVVLPECAVQGYMNPAQGLTWSITPQSENELQVSSAAESIPGPSTRYFATLCKELRIYLALPLIEGAKEEFFNTLVLIDPRGEIVAHHRKKNLWQPGDAQWATVGTLKPSVAETPFGRLGLMICFDVHIVAAQLRTARADIVLYSVGWYGPNTENWYRDIFPRRYIKPNGFAVVSANWCGESGGETWHGQGYSNIASANGETLAMAKSTAGTEIVYADLPIREKTAAERDLIVDEE